MFPPLRSLYTIAIVQFKIPPVQVVPVHIFRAMNKASNTKLKLGGSSNQSEDEKRLPTHDAPSGVRLTFGVELEFWYEYHRIHQSELDELGSHMGIDRMSIPQENLVYEIVAKLLSNYQIPVNDVYLGHWGRERQHTDEKWTVKEECLEIESYSTPNITKFEIEVTSRILDFEKESFEEVRLVLAVLENFPGPYKFYVNRFTGLHVHVGALQEKFCLPWLKRFCQTVTAFEHEIESLHPDSRIQNLYAEAPSTVPGLLSRVSPITSLAVLELSKDFEGLKSVFMNDSRYKAYNIDFITDPDTYPSDMVKEKQTIEFRQHAGSLDPDTICNWVEFVGALVKYTFHADHKENLMFLMNHLKSFPDTAYTIEDLMKKIGVPHLFAWYRNNDKIYERDRVLTNDLPELDPRIKVPDVKFLWDLLLNAETGAEVGVELRGVKREPEDDEEEEEEEQQPFVRKRRQVSR